MPGYAGSQNPPRSYPASGTDAMCLILNKRKLEFQMTHVVDISSRTARNCVVSTLISRRLGRKRPVFEGFLALNHFDFSSLTLKVADYFILLKMQPRRTRSNAPRSIGAECGALPRRRYVAFRRGLFFCSLKFELRRGAQGFGNPPREDTRPTESARPSPPHGSSEEFHPGPRSFNGQNWRWFSGAVRGYAVNHDGE
jgi:hypothetical protein